MKLALKDISMMDLATAVGAKVNQFEKRPVPGEGMVGVCRLDGKRMRTTEARRILEERYTAKKGG